MSQLSKVPKRISPGRVCPFHGNAVWQTPAEFMRATLARLPLPAAPVRRLTALFEVARFSAHPLGLEARDVACDCLDEIGTALEEDAARER